MLQIQKDTMNKHKLLTYITLTSLIFSCGSNNDLKKKFFSLKTENDQAKYQIGQTIKAQILNKKNKQIDSVVFFLNNQKIAKSNNLSFSEKVDNERLGKHLLKAIVYFEGNTEEVFQKLTFLNNTPPKVYSYKIIDSYPHDSEAFTQGLEFVGDTLYESTGRNGFSSLRKTNYQTGEIIQKVDLHQKYFAEGITILNNQILQLTWQSKKGFKYDLSTLQKTGEFRYQKSKEGWGLCNDGQKIYKSDGSQKIWTLNPETLEEESYIEVATNKSVKSKFNELEWIDGKIYANTWQKDGIAIINPKNGALEAVINLAGLRKEVTQSENLDVLNGIAYKKNTNQLFVTGKNWDKIFEIEIIK